MPQANKYNEPRERIRNEIRSEITLNKHHYPDHLIDTGIATFKTRPAILKKTEDGDTVAAFESEDSRAADEFANHLISVRRQMKRV